MIITVVAIKGGVGKTTVTFCLAAVLTKLGKKVLCIDLDSQGDLSASMGVEKDTSPFSIGEILNAPKREQKSLMEQAVVEVEGWGDLITPGSNLATLEREIETGLSSETRLADALSKLSEQYDYILLDTPKGQGLLTINALIACEQVLIPVQTEYLATKNLPELMELVADVADRANPHIAISALVPNQMKRTALCQQVYEQLQEWDIKDYLPHQDAPLFISPPIHQLTLYTELSAMAVPISKYPGVTKRHLEPFQALAAHLESQFVVEGVA